MKITKATLLAQRQGKPYLTSFSVEGIEGEFCVRRLSMADLHSMIEGVRQLEKRKNVTSHDLLYQQFNSLICDENGGDFFDSLEEFQSYMEPWLASKCIEHGSKLVQVGPKKIEEAVKN
jgi:hypothetical protein